MSLSPLDFIYNNLEKPQHLEVSSELRKYLNTYEYARHIEQNPISYDAVHKYGFSSNSFKVTPSKVIDFLNSFLPSNSSSKDFEPEIYIPGVRYMTPGIVVFERPPSYQHISVSLAYRDDINEDTELYEWYLPIPWQVYIAAYNPVDMRIIDVKMFFTSSTLYSVDQPVYVPPLFNFYSNGKLCRPFFESMDDFEKYPQNISGIIAAAFDWVWNSGFNKDITENISEFIYRKRHLQFEKYITSPSLLSTFNKVKANPLTGIPSSLHSTYINAFYNAWECVPIEDISSFIWSPYSSADFFYQEMSSYNIRSLIEIYVNNNDLSVHEYDDDHYDEDGDEYCPDNCITEEDLLSSPDFKQFLEENTSKLEAPKPLGPAIQHFVEYLRQSNIAQRPINSSLFRKLHFENSSILSS